MDSCSLNWFWESALGRWRKFSICTCSQEKLEPRVSLGCICMCACSVMSDSLWPPGGSPPGSSVHGIFQARIQQWVAIFSSRGSPWPRDRTHVSCIFCILRIPPSHLSLGMGSANKFPSQNFISMWSIASNISSFLSEKNNFSGISLVVQWLELRSPTAEGTGSISGWGIKIPHATQCSQKLNK